MNVKRAVFLGLIALGFLAHFMPYLNNAILRSNLGNPIRLTVIPEGELGADGWFRGPVRVRATSTPETVITYAVNGGEVQAGNVLLLEQPGEYSIEWNACKGESCHEGFAQAVKIVTTDLRPLSFDPDRREWSFPAQVIRIQEGSLLRSPVQVAKVKARNFEIWVILQIHRLALADEEIEPGDLVRIWISGSHVSLSEIDWQQCARKTFASEVSDFEYCSMGEVLDDGLLNLDSGYKLSPSNELIREGRTASRWQTGALYWNTSLTTRSEE